MKFLSNIDFSQEQSIKLYDVDHSFIQNAMIITSNIEEYNTSDMTKSLFPCLSDVDHVIAFNLYLDLDLIDFETSLQEEFYGFQDTNTKKIYLISTNKKKVHIIDGNDKRNN